MPRASAIRFITAIICCVLLLAVRAQRATDHNSHLWISALGDHRILERWSIHTEAHVRQTEMGARPQQLLLRPAINFHVGADLVFTAGYSYYRNYRYGAHPIKTGTWEHNVYQQMQIASRLGKVTLQHRFRLEQRFLAVMTTDPSRETGYAFDRYDYQSRFRARFMATLPLGAHAKLEAGTYFLSAYDEVFLNFGDEYRLDFMNQNRISGLLGFQFNAVGSFQIGYLLQTLQRPGAASGADLVEANSTLHILFTCNLDFRKPPVTAGAAKPE